MGWIKSDKEESAEDTEQKGQSEEILELLSTQKHEKQKSNLSLSMTQDGDKEAIRSWLERSINEGVHYTECRRTLHLFVV